MAGEKILLVDDEVDFVEALSARLETRDLVVHVAKNGHAALDKVSKITFDAIIMDLAMPGMDGVEVLCEMKKTHPDVQVIFLTGRATLEKGVEAMKLGAMDFLEKPVDMDLLLKKIREAKSKSDNLSEKKTDQLIKDILGAKGW